MKIFVGIGILAVALLLYAAETKLPDAPIGAVHFTDITKQAGIHFTHNSGRAGKKFLPETSARASRSLTPMAMDGPTFCC